MKADAQTEAQVLGCLNGMLAAYGSGRVDEAIGYFVDDDDITLIETGPDQWWIGREQVRRGAQLDWETTEGEMPVEFTPRNVAAAGDVAWVNGELRINIRFQGRDLDLEARATAILRREGDRWLMHTLHVAVPNREMAPGQQWPERPLGTPAA